MTQPKRTTGRKDTLAGMIDERIAAGTAVPVKPIATNAHTHDIKAPVSAGGGGGGGTPGGGVDPEPLPVTSLMRRDRIDLPNNDTATYVFGPGPSFAGVDIHFMMWRGTGNEAVSRGTMSAFHDGTTGQPATDIIPDFHFASNGFDSNMLPHFTYSAALSGGNLVLSVTSSDDATLGGGDIRLSIIYSWHVEEL